MLWIMQARANINRSGHSSAAETELMEVGHDAALFAKGDAPKKGAR